MNPLSTPAANVTTPLPPFDAALAAAVAAEQPDADDERPVCGWFDSSWALRQGLAVSELPDSDGSVAALWFAQLAPAGSAQWQ